MISFELSEEQEDLRKTYHQIAQSQLRPLYLDLSEKKSDLSVYSRFVKILTNEQFNSFLIPKKYGGKQFDAVTTSIILEEIAWGALDLTTVYQPNYHAIITLLIAGSEEQKEEFFPLMLNSPECVSSFCVTEAKGGSDSSSFSTTASLKDEVYILNGKKRLVFNGGHSLFYVVWSNMDTNKSRSGINVFIVPKELAGISCCEHSGLGLCNVPVAEVSFENVEVPKKYLIGDPGSGYLLLMQTLDWARAFVGATCVGAARAALEEAVEYSKTRIIRNRPIINHQGVGFTLAELAAQLEAARLMVWKACRLIDLNLDYAVASSISKLLASELAVRATSEGMLILGQASVDPSMVIGKMLKYAQLMRTFEGTNHVQKAMVAERL